MWVMSWCSREATASHEIAAGLFSGSPSYVMYPRGSKQVEDKQQGIEPLALEQSVMDTVKQEQERGGREM